MRFKSMFDWSLTATAIVGMLATVPASAQQAANQRRPARVGQLPPGTERPTGEVLLSTGQGELITLPAAVANVWTSNPAVADVYVSNARQIHLFGKDGGEATVFATSATGAVVYASNVRVSQNITSVDRMLRAAMPESDIRVVTAGQMAVLTGTVASPDDAAQAKLLVTSMLNPGLNINDPATPLRFVVHSRLRTATPLQVNLQVKIAEVSRELAKNIGANLATVDSTGGFKFGIGRGRAFNPQYTPGGPLGTGVTTGPDGSTIVTTPSTGTVLSGAGRLLGLDILGALDLGEQDGQVTTLASPNLTALSGETASFLAGGEVPIPIAQGLGAVGVEFKQYGVSLSFSPTVLADGRISIRVRPEVSQLTTAGAVTIGGTQIPALTTRRAETTVELGSGQSFMIGGLIQNTHSNNTDKTPGVGDVPILGALFRSNSFRRAETELMIVVTPYLVKPANAADIRLPTDGYRAPTDLGRVFLGQSSSGESGAQRPVPTVAPAGTVMGQGAPLPPAPAQAGTPPRGTAAAPRKGAAAPGFSF